MRSGPTTLTCSSLAGSLRSSGAADLEIDRRAGPGRAHRQPASPARRGRASRSRDRSRRAPTHARRRRGSGQSGASPRLPRSRSTTPDGGMAGTRSLVSARVHAARLARRRGGSNISSTAVGRRARRRQRRQRERHAAAHPRLDVSAVEARQVELERRGLAAPGSVRPATRPRGRRRRRVEIGAGSADRRAGRSAARCRTARRAGAPRRPVARRRPATSRSLRPADAMRRRCPRPSCRGSRAPSAVNSSSGARRRAGSAQAAC